MKRVAAVFVLVVMLVMLVASPVYAIAAPTSVALTTPIQVYRNLIETGDTLFIAKYNIIYGENPDENISEAYLGRLLDSTDEPIGAIEPYAYFNDGYSYGIFSLYFSSGLVTWEGTYTIQLIGNPGLSWTGEVPVVAAASLNWNDSNSGLGNYVLTLADELEVAWEVDLVAPSPSGLRLTSTYGEAYFTNAIPNLKLFVPEIFAVGATVPQVVPEDHELTYMEQLLGRWGGTEYDEAFNDLADYFDMPRNFLTGGFFLVLGIVGSGYIIKSTHSAKPLPLFIILLLMLGALSGLVSPLAPILMAVGFVLFIGYILFYKPSS